MFNKTLNQRAQSITEYILLVGIITLALFTMMQTVKRGTQSMIKTAADQIGVQSNSDQSFSREQGYLNFQNTVTSSDRQKQVIDHVGVMNYILNESETTLMHSQTNMGFTEVNQ